VLLKNVTDGAHLDETPRMKLVDAVDAMADNRGELLFEMRGQTQRQFALYRVLRGQAEKLFVSGGGELGAQPPNKFPRQAGGFMLVGPSKRPVPECSMPTAARRPRRRRIGC